VILDRLHSLEESPWNRIGKPPKALDASGLAHRLRPFGVRPAVIRLSASTARGYHCAALADAWARYLPREERRNERNDVTPQVTDSAGVTGDVTGVTPQGRDVTPVTPAVTGAAPSDQDCYGVTSVTPTLAQTGTPDDADIPLCAVCDNPMDPRLAGAGFTTHPACDPGEEPPDDDEMPPW
jgi:hypothetical protein